MPVERVQLASLSTGTVVSEANELVPDVPVFVYTHGTTTEVPVYAAESSSVVLLQPSQTATNASGQIPGWIVTGQTVDLVVIVGGVALPAMEADAVRGDTVGGVGPAGPVGPQGPAGPAGSGAGGTIPFSFLTPTSVWVMPHNQGRFGLYVYIQDSGGSQVIGNVSYPDSNTVVVTFTSPHAGIGYVET